MKADKSQVLLSPEDEDLRECSMFTNSNSDHCKYLVVGTKKFGNKYLHRIVAKRMGLESSIKNKTHIDHINRNIFDNRRENLRLVSCSANRLNTQKNFEYKGFYLDDKNHHRRKKYRVTLTFNGKTKNYGYFATEEEARKCYVEAKNKLLTELGLFDLLLEK